MAGFLGGIAVTFLLVVACDFFPPLAEDAVSKAFSEYLRRHSGTELDFEVRLLVLSVSFSGAVGKSGCDEYSIGLRCRGLDLVCRYLGGPAYQDWAGNPALM